MSRAPAVFCLVRGILSSWDALSCSREKDRERESGSEKERERLSLGCCFLAHMLPCVSVSVWCVAACLLCTIVMTHCHDCICLS